MAELMIGAGAAVGFLLLVRFVNERDLNVTGWQWALTFLWLLFVVFVLEVVVGFLREGTPKGAVVMGTVLGFFAVVWAVILGRIVFSGTGSAAKAPADEGGSYA